MKKRKVCVVTGTRAEYGLLRGIIDGLQSSDDLSLCLVVTGMHLSPEFGFTCREIEADGMPISAKVEMLLSADTATAISKSMALGLIGFADAYARLEPDLVLVLGDRFEIFAAATAAMIAGIPIAHLHGGETTEGAFDEAIRHSITKMSHLHFVAAPAYRQRVVQMGEDPERVFLVGGMGVDAIKRLSLLDRPSFERSIDFTLRPRNLLVTFHPVTLDAADGPRQMHELLAALGTLDDTGLIFTMPNADTGGRQLKTMIQEFVNTHPNARAFDSLGQLRYLSAMRFVDAVVGNSSSGICEAPTFKIGTVDIGDRQKGRLRATSVVSCEPNRAAITNALQTVLSPAFRASLETAQNPYGDGGATGRVLEVLRTQPLHAILKKTFHDWQPAATAASFSTDCTK